MRKLSADGKPDDLTKMGLPPDVGAHMNSLPTRESGLADGVTNRSLLIAFALLVLCAPAAFFSELLYGGTVRFSSGIVPMAPVVLLLLLSSAAYLPGLRRIGLSRRELLVVYAVLTVGAPLVGHYTLFLLVPRVIALYYGAQMQPDWGLFLPYIPTWFAPTNPQAIAAFFTNRGPVPWGLWWAPLGIWSMFAFAIFLAGFCSVLLLQRHWVTSERLSFPIAQIPLELIHEPRHNQQPRAAIAKLSGLQGIGLACSLGLCFLSELAQRVPSLPSIQLKAPGVTLLPWHGVGPLAGLGEITLCLEPTVIAIAFLVPKELSFSCWFFWFVRVAMTIIAIAAGGDVRPPDQWWDSTFPAPSYQGYGAVLALLVCIIWAARHHLTQVLRSLVAPRTTPDTNCTGWLYRGAVIGLVVSLGFLLYFCHLAGCRFFFSLTLLSLILSYHLVWTRLRAESGVAFLSFPMALKTAIVMPFGSNAIRPIEFITMTVSGWAHFPGLSETSDVSTQNAMDAFKLADAAGINARRLAGVMVLGFLLSLVVGVIVVLAGTYHYSYFDLEMGRRMGWPLREDGGDIVDFMMNPGESDGRGLLAVMGGALVTVGLTAMRSRCWWWPFHPVGYLAAMSWGMQAYWGPFFLGWLLKVLVTRYGGLRLYRQVVPLAIGLAVGELVNDGLWAAISVLTRGRF